MQKLSCWWFQELNHWINMWIKQIITLRENDFHFSLKHFLFFICIESVQYFLLLFKQLYWVAKRRFNSSRNFTSDIFSKAFIFSPIINFILWNKKTKAPITGMGTPCFLVKDIVTFILTSLSLHSCFILPPAPRHSMGSPSLQGTCPLFPISPPPQHASSLVQALREPLSTGRTLCCSKSYFS